jgi:hypothetical protein
VNPSLVTLTHSLYSFKKQKEELERIEKEEREREELAAKSKTMDSFYKQVLERKEAEHRTVMEAMSKNKNKSGSSSTQQESLDAVLAKEAKKSDVEVNDNNEVIDKRQLLGAGLNVKSKFGSLSSLASTDDRVKERMDEYNEYKQRKLQEARSKRHGNDDERERLSREVERQMIETKKKQEEDELRKQKELEEKATAKRTSADAALSARERFLARKKQKLEEENKKKGK